MGAALHTSLSDGLAPDTVEARRAAFGANKFKAIPPKSFFKLWFGNLKDPTLIMLMAAALVRTLLMPSSLAAVFGLSGVEHVEAVLRPFEVREPASEGPCVGASRTASSGAAFAQRTEQPSCPSASCHRSLQYWALQCQRSGRTMHGQRAWRSGWLSWWCPSLVCGSCGMLS